MKTLFKALVKYADDQGLLEKPYHAPVRFMWQLDLNPDGSLASRELTPLSTPREVRGKLKEERGRVVTVPRMTRTSGVSPMLGSDDIAYVLGWVPEAPDPGDTAAGRAHEKAVRGARERHEAWTALTRRWAASPAAAHDPIPHALVKFLESGVDEVLQPAEWSSKDGVIIHVGMVPAPLASSAAPFWIQHVEGTKGSGRVGLCLICGMDGPVVDSFPQPVKGPLIPNGQTSGVAPVSVNEDVYGYGLRRGLEQVPICVNCAQAIPNSLNHLLSDTTRAHRSPDAATTWWVDGASNFNALDALSPTQDSAVADLIQRVHSGRGTRHALDLDQFYAVTLEANGPRMIVHEWTQMPLITLQENILAWFAHVRLQPLWPQGRAYQPLWLLANATGRHDPETNRYMTPSDKGGRHPHAILETLQTAALQRRPLPRHIASHVVSRVAADGHVDDPRVALLRLYLTRSQSLKGTPMPGLDPDNTQPAYLLGRLMSVYEDTQYAAATVDGGDPPNATFVDKYLAGAITSPRLVLTAGGRQAPAWLSKLRRSGRDWFHRRDMDEIIAELSPADPGPTRATLDEQALFLLGYHHQRAHSNAARATAAANSVAKAQGHESAPDPNISHRNPSNAQ